jgi:hypothetical protein
MFFFVHRKVLTAMLKDYTLATAVRTGLKFFMNYGA